MPAAKPKPDPNRLVAPERRDEDELESSLRPKRLSEFVGQKQARENLAVFIEAAKARNEPLDHVLFSGPPGLGKTTLAQIVARELGVNCRMTSGPVLVRAGDLAALLTNLEARDVLFIDEIHRLNPVVEDAALARLEVDQQGLDAFDRRYLALIAEAFGGGPVGLDTLAAALGEPSDAIEEIVEPYLLQQGLVQRTPRGRMLTGKAFAHLGLPAPPVPPQQPQLFRDDEE